MSKRLIIALICHRHKLLDQKNVLQNYNFTHILFGCEAWSFTLREEQRFTVKITIFWDVTPCSLVDMHQHFGRTDYHHLQGTKLRQ
jgi:hypothetical protein